MLESSAKELQGPGAGAKRGKTTWNQLHGPRPLQRPMHCLDLKTVVEIVSEHLPKQFLGTAMEDELAT